MSGNTINHEDVSSGFASPAGTLDASVIGTDGSGNQTIKLLSAINHLRGTHNRSECSHTYFLLALWDIDASGNLDITANSITANEIAANTITANEITANTITAGQIAADTITATEITAETITATEINTASLVADIITTENLNAEFANFGDLAAETATIGTLNTTMLDSDAIVTRDIRVGPTGSTGGVENAAKIGTNGAGTVPNTTLTGSGAHLNKFGDFFLGVHNGARIFFDQSAGTLTVKGTLDASDIVAGTLNAKQY